jgi:hypothetical protein
MRVYCSPKPQAIDLAGNVTFYPVTSVVVRDQAVGGNTVEAPTPYQDADGDWYFDTSDSLYTGNVKYYADFYSTVDSELGYSTKPFRAVASTVGAPTGPASIRILPSLASTSSVSVLLTPPPNANYDHCAIEAIPMGGGAAITVSGISGTVVIAGLKAATAFLILATPYNADGIAGPVGPLSWAVGSTLAEAKPQNWARISIYVNDEKGVHERGPFYYDPDAEAGKAYPITSCGRFRIARIRSDCPCPVAHDRTDGLGFLVSHQMPLTGAPSTSKGG